MRKIKFRFRLKLIVDSFGKYKKGDIEFFYIELDSLSRFSIDKHWEILSRDEYTGLNDVVNGTEIYENDIVKETNKKGIVKIKIITFHNGSFRISTSKNQNTKSKCVLFAQRIVAAKIEVIGNIHENKTA